MERKVVFGQNIIISAVLLKKHKMMHIKTMCILIQSLKNTSGTSPNHSCLNNPWLKTFVQHCV
jgi:hypothetical protein